jgi:catechol 2,3-dioxygenase-like lactoylglutathione lyase family enzyme
MATTTHVFSGIAVADYARAVEWYTRLWGRPPDMVPHEAEVVWWLTSSASFYVVADRARAGKGLLTVILDDLDRLLAELAGRGLTPESTEGLPDELRRAVFSDPEGNRVTFGQLPIPHPDPPLGFKESSQHP